MVKFKRLRKANAEIVKELLMDIRKPDLKELIMGPVNSFDAVWQSIDNSKYCYAVRDDERKLLALFGIASVKIDVNGTAATPVWFLATNRACRHNRAMVYYGRQFCRRFIDETGPLCNYIWAGNDPAIRYIQHMGATLLDVIPMGRNGEMFVPFLLSEVK